MGDLGFGHHRAHRQRDHFTMDGLGQRKGEAAKLLRIGLLMVRRDRVMDRGMYALVEQALLEGRAIGYADHEKMPDMGILADVDGRETHGRVLDLVTITLGDCTAMRVIGIEVRQLYPEDGRLHFVEAVVWSLD